MIPFHSLCQSPLRLLAGVLVAFVAGCGGGGLDPILGTPALGTTPAVTDTTRPTVLLTVPAPAAVNVPTNTRITAVFSEDMAPASFVGTTFTVTDTTLGQAVAGDVSYSAN